MFGGGSKGSSRGNAPKFGDALPNQTLYLQGLNDKVKIPTLKACLFELFSSYGEVIDIVAGSAQRKRGQAFVVFRDISCATNAMRALQSYNFLDKNMRINYARTKSDCVALEDGTFKPRHGPHAEKHEDVAKVKSLSTGGVKSKIQGGSAKNVLATPMRGAGAMPQSRGADATPAGEQASNVLMVENLPAEMNAMMLNMLFRQYPGFQEARPIPGRNLAFIEYADELQAGVAKHGLQGFKVTPEMALKIAFAK